MTIKDQPLQYLCTVYSSNEGGLVKAYYEAAELTGNLLMRGEWVYCPIVHGHTPAALVGLPTGFDWWMALDEGFIDKCDALLVATMPHWDTSRGISHEIAYAKKQGKPIRYLNPETLEITDDE